MKITRTGKRSTACDHDYNHLDHHSYHDYQNFHDDQILIVFRMTEKLTAVIMITMILITMIILITIINYYDDQ